MIRCGGFQGTIAMGNWGYGVMDGDEECDLEYKFKKTFAGRIPQPNEVIGFMMTPHGCDYHRVRQVVGYLVINNNLPMSAELKQFILSGIDDEDYTIWKEPDERKQALSEFREIVLAYWN